MKNNKIIKFILKHAVAISACVLVLVFSIGYWVLSAVPTATSVGNNVIVAGTVGIGTDVPAARLDIDHGAGSGSVFRIAQAGRSCRFEPYGAVACPAGWVTIGPDPTNNYRLCMNCE